MRGAVVRRAMGKTLEGDGEHVEPPVRLCVGNRKYHESSDFGT